MTITLTAAEQAVLIAVFEQIDISKIDKEKLQVDLGSPTKGAANKRITRLREKLSTWAGAGVDNETTFTAAEQAVLIATLGQVDFGKVDKAKLQTDLGLPSKGAVGKRISRLREKLNGRAGSGIPSSTSATAASSAKKVSQSNKKVNHGTKGSTKGGKAAMVNADEESSVGFASKDKGHSSDFELENAVAATPTANTEGKKTDDEFHSDA